MLRLIIKDNTQSCNRDWNSYRVFEVHNWELEQYLRTKREAEQTLDVVGFELVDKLEWPTAMAEAGPRSSIGNGTAGNLHNGQVSRNPLPRTQPPAIPTFASTTDASLQAQAELKAKLLEKRKSKQSFWKNFFQKPAPTPSVIPLPLP